jgi:hypothetical protein
MLSSALAMFDRQFLLISFVLDRQVTSPRELELINEDELESYIKDVVVVSSHDVPHP